ncbi:MAG: DNA cytosine methyltransferase [Acidaminococcaceae bacterium]|nr:DNA cytosine methyltransferase [Acidaminococcaceae bacterium]
MRIVDLFSGAGGLTFGFYYNLIDGNFIRNEDNEILFANEFDHQAAEAFRLNYPDVNMIERDIKLLKEEEIRRLIGDNEVDVVIGGPPCQSYSTIGKRVYDDKAKLYNEYYRILNIIRPRMFLFENVTGLLSMKDENKNSILEDIKKKFEFIADDFGYHIYPGVLDAADYGVPQHRERVFIIGVQKNLKLEWNFPEKNNTEITLKEAISDFPIITSGQEAHDYGETVPVNEYQRLMRGDTQELTCHFVAEYGDKIQTIINHVIQGEGKNYINGLVDKGILAERYRLTSGYKNTYGRLYSDRPCTTITHNMSTPSGLRCIHYEQNRALSPREGARIQSFPDWFRFSGNHVQIKRQIGNAVPPLLAMKLAEQIRHTLEQEDVYG